MPIFFSDKNSRNAALTVNSYRNRCFIVTSCKRKRCCCGHHAYGNHRHQDAFHEISFHIVFAKLYPIWLVGLEASYQLVYLPWLLTMIKILRMIPLVTPIGLFYNIMSIPCLPFVKDPITIATFPTFVSRKSSISRIFLYFTIIPSFLDCTCSIRIAINLNCLIRF